MDAMSVQAAAKRVEVLAAVPDGLAPARANPEKLQRVLFNLVQNAIRHTPPDGSVTVAAESNGQNVEIEVADTRRGAARRGARAGVRALLPRRGREGPLGRRLRTRPHHLPGDRGGARRPDLVRGVCKGHASQVHSAACRLTPSSYSAASARSHPAASRTYGDLSPGAPDSPAPCSRSATIRACPGSGSCAPTARSPRASASDGCSSGKAFPSAGRAWTCVKRGCRRLTPSTAIRQSRK